MKIKVSLSASSTAAITPATLTHKQINIISEWQNYGSGVKSTLKAMVKFLPTLTGVPKYVGPVYRVVALDLKTLKELLSKKKLVARPLEGWTKTLRNVHEYISFTYGSMLGDNSVCAVIFNAEATARTPSLDLEALWKNKALNALVEKLEDQGKYFSEGIEFKGSQKEVIAAFSYLKLADVVEVLYDQKIFKAKSVVKTLERVVVENS